MVIGLNDAERIVPADITIFHDDWVPLALADNGYRSRLYVCPMPFSPAHGSVAQARYEPMADGSDVMMQRLLDAPQTDFVIEEVLFISALKIARMIAEFRKRPQTVYMVGFDFTPEKGYASAIRRDYAPGEADLKAMRISPQEFYLLNTLYMLRESELVLQHVGDRAFSALSPETLNATFLSAPPDDNNGAANRVLVTAELTTNHFGDRHRLERMIRAAKAAGADYVKLQKRNVDTFYSKDQLDGKYVSPFGTTFRDYRRALELDRDDFARVDELCRELRIRWFTSILDEPSFRFMQQFEPELVKLPSTISEHTDYLAHVARTYRGGIVLSTGMTDIAYENWVLQTFTHCDQLYLMQANSAYPTPAQDCDIGVIRHYRDLSRNHPHLIPAYSSHDIGWLGSALAVAAGARMVEKHVKLGNTEWAHFDVVAVDLTTSEFKDYVVKIRETERILGSENKKVNDSEHHKYRK